MRVFYHKFPPSAYPPTTGGRSREIRLSRSDQVARRATRGALRSKVERALCGVQIRYRQLATGETGGARLAKLSALSGLHEKLVSRVEVEMWRRSRAERGDRVEARSRHRRSALVPDFSVICIVRVVHAVDIAGSDVNLTAPRAVGPLHLYQ